MLKVITCEKALEIIKNEFKIINAGTESVSLAECLGRVLSESIVSSESIPAFDRSTVDGFAVIASDTYGSSESIPSQLDVIGEIPMGEKSSLTVNSGECVRISTGGMLPCGCDSVVMVENTDTSFDNFALIYKSVSPFENVTKKGDDIKTGQTVFEKGRALSSREIGALSCLGITRVNVYKKPRVGIISTGDEIIPAESEAVFGKIRDVNTHILSALVRELGCECVSYGIIKDNYGDIYSAVKKAVSENDIVLISGGSSAGTRDMTADIISSLGEVFFHGLSMKPGKPTIVGKIDNKAVFGLPGHPVAAYFVALRLISPLVSMVLGKSEKAVTLKGRLTQNISSNHGREEIVCVRYADGEVSPVFGKSGVVSLLSEGDGYIIIDRNCEGLRSGEEVTVNLFQKG